LVTFPKSKHAPEARAKIAELRRSSRSEPAASPDKPKSSGVSASNKLHATILAKLKTFPVRHSIYPTRIGKNFGELYESDASPKALTVCIDWQLTRPDYIPAGPLANSNSTDEVKSLQDVIQRSRRICEEGKRGQACGCTLVDLNGYNVLDVPEWWAQKWSQ
jgi:hypothetical protein